VNGRSEVLREHCWRSGGGLWFDRYGRFEGALDTILGDAGLSAAMGRRGRAYVEANYRWPTLVERYRAFAQGVAATS
jgi:glycosyltransferase involved in cell wall biosynthesis